MEKLLHSIQKERKELHELMEMKKCLDKKVLKKSRSLDQKIVQYHRTANVTK